MAKRELERATVNVRIKLAALWGSVMFLYIYADYFGLYVPGVLQSMLAGKMGPLGPTTQGVLVGTSLLMAIPSSMIFLSVWLPARAARVLNIVFGLLYSLVISLTMWGWLFFRVYGVLEIALTLFAVVLAWRWPRVEAGTESAS